MRPPADVLIGVSPEDPRTVESRRIEPKGSLPLLEGSRHGQLSRPPPRLSSPSEGKRPGDVQRRCGGPVDGAVNSPEVGDHPEDAAEEDVKTAEGGGYRLRQILGQRSEDNVETMSFRSIRQSTTGEALVQSGQVGHQCQRQGNRRGSHFCFRSIELYMWG